MTNEHNLQDQKMLEIENLTVEQLHAIRVNIQSREYDDDETRQAVAQYVADGGEIGDLLS